jgi:predicted alpha/beta superfamily hydrolase
MPRWLLASLCLLAACGAPPPITGEVLTRSLRSAATGVEYDVFVRLPPGHGDDPATLYPVVVQLDATFFGQFELAAGHASALEASGAIPPVVVVGIGRAADPYDVRARQTDFAPPPLDPASTSPGRADLFLTLLRDELLPPLDAEFGLDPSRRVLSGHSLGGLFALYALFAGEEDGGALFEHVIAADPSYGHDRGVIFGHEERLGGTGPASAASAYLTVGVETGAAQVVYLDAMRERLAAWSAPRLRVGTAALGADHLGALAPSIAEGLTFALGGER